MASRGRTAIFAGISAVIALGLAVVLVFAVISMKRDADVHKADEAAEHFKSQFDNFERQVVADLRNRQISRDVDGLMDVADTALDGAPELPKVPKYGSEHSEAYQDAADRQERLVKPLGDVKTAAERAKEAEVFSDEAEKLLRVKPSDFISVTRHRNGDALRKKVVAGYRKAIDKFDSVKVPEGQDKLAKQVRGAAAYGMKEAEKVAKGLDAGRSGVIRYYQKVPAARLALLKYRNEVTSQLREAVDAVGSDASNNGGNGRDFDDDPDEPTV